MSILIFIIILGILIFVHELGHFLVAKKAGVRVDEFAIGFPPRLFSFKKGETTYAINLIPLGGYVKIFGESADEESLDPNRKDSFINKSRWVQAAVLVGGVVFNIIFAWILLSISLMFGFPTIVSDQNRDQITESYVVVTNVFEDSPASSAGLQAGDQILNLSAGENSISYTDLTVSSLQEFIASSESEVNFEIIRSGENMNLAILPESGIVGDNPAVGIGIDRIGRLQLGFFSAFVQGFTMTGQMMIDMTTGIGTLLGQAFTGNGSLDDVAGPVGIVGLVGNAANFGITYLLGFTAFISINLAVLNILPLPALDGGRLVIVLIEGILNKRIKPEIVNSVNTVGFLALILLMIVITINDVIRLF